MPEESSNSPEPLAPAPVHTGNTVTLGDVVRFLWNNALLILGFALVSAVSMASIILFFIPDRYEATATLIVTPPTFSSTLKPPILSVQGYQKLLESDALIAETKQRLVSQGVMEPEDPLGLGSQVRTRIFVSRASDAQVLAPILEIIATASSPELASAMADTWAKVFLEDNRRLNSSSTLNTIQFIEEQFVSNRDSLEEMERERREIANEYQEKLDGVTTQWDRRLVGFQQETEQQLLKYQAQTRGVMETVTDAAWEQIPSGVAGGLRRALTRYALLKTQLAQTPEFVILEKAISDDALWNTVALQPERVSELQTRTLVTREVNPVHHHLSLELSQIELQLDEVGQTDRELFRQITSDLDTLQRQRSAELSSLRARREVALEALKMEKLRDIETLRRERAERLVRLDREIESTRQIFGELATKYEQAELAKAELNLADIQLGSSAVPPLRPAPKGFVPKTLLTFILGAILGLLFAIFRAVLRRS